MVDIEYQTTHTYVSLYSWSRTSEGCLSSSWLVQFNVIRRAVLFVRTLVVSLN